MPQKMFKLDNFGVFFYIYEKCRCQKTSQLFGLDKFYIGYWHLKVVTYLKIELFSCTSSLLLELT